MQKKHMYSFVVIVFIFVFNLRVNGQDLRGTPANYPGVLAGIEWNTISRMTGVEYERIIITRNNLTAGIKASYMFPYEKGNMKLFGTCCGDIASVATALVTADLFTSERSFHSGFFLHAALGAGRKQYEWEAQRKVIQVRPAFEAGVGWLFPVGRRLAIKWTNTLTFPSRDGGITFTRLAFGF
jgi:hypothetical protein